MERREFLAALAAPVALPITARSSVARDAEPIASAENHETNFLAARFYDADGALVRTKILGAAESPESAKKLADLWRHDGETMECVRFRFRPLGRERRFLPIRTSWQPAGEFAKEEYVNFPDPVSLADIPNTEGVEDWYVDREGWLTRDQAFAETARRNAESATEAARESGYLTGCWWWNVCEFGRPLVSPLIHFTVESGVGQAESSVEYPTRLVMPTAAERAMYPLPAALLEPIS